jgi:hypothetical protein
MSKPRIRRWPGSIAWACEGFTQGVWRRALGWTLQEAYTYWICPEMEHWHKALLDATPVNDVTRAAIKELDYEFLENYHRNPSKPYSATYRRFKALARQVGAAIRDRLGLGEQASHTPQRQTPQTRLSRSEGV